MVPGQERELTMRKSTLLFLLSCSLLFGCGNNNSDYGSEKGQSCAKQAVETITHYCDGTFTYERAEATLNKLCDDMNYVFEDIDKDSNPNHSADFGIHSAILSAYLNLIDDNYKNNAESYDNLQEDIDNLQKYTDN